jgi:nitroreductase
MMKTLDQIIATRRSVRAFDANRPVPKEHIRAMAEAARLAPSACNSQTWRFIAVTRSEIIEKICKTAMRPVIPNKWLAQAPLLMVGCARLDIVANRIGARVTGTEYYQVDMGIALEHMVLKATELELGTCWIGWFAEKKIKAILDIPRGVKVLALLAVGYPADDGPAKRSRKPMEKILFSEIWGNPFTFSG